MTVLQKILKTIVCFTACFVVCSFHADSQNPLDEELNEYKAECKELIKPARYEGARVTYYKIAKKIQTKNLEIYFNQDAEYTIAFSAKLSTVNVNINFYYGYDDDRILIYTENSIEGKNITVSSNLLNEAYREKVDPQGRIKSIYIEYEIGSGKEKPEGVVMVIGSKPISR
jgi:hypothetical protein